MASATAAGNRQNPVLVIVGQLWDAVTAPPASIDNRHERRRARLLVALLAFLNIANIGLFVAYQSAGSTFASVVPITTAALIGMYILSRTPFYKWAAVMSIGVITITLFYLVYTGDAPINVNWIYYLFLGILLAGLWFTSRAAWIVFLLDVAGIVVLSLTTPTLTPDRLLYPIGYFIISAGLYLFFMRHRDILEDERQEELSTALGQTRIANDALANANINLEKVNTDLVRANALAKENARLKGEFMSTMSHELRTPLNAIIGFTGIMLEGMGGEVDNEARHMIQRIDANSQRLLTLINDVLDLAKIEAGRLEVVTEAMSPRELVSQWQAQMSVLADNKGLTFDVSVAPDLPEMINGDSQRLTQVVVNLLSNAFKFTDRGGVRLDVEREGDNWTIRVTDSGVGIPPHAINYIFDEFRQLDGSTKRMYGGTGLGLAIVRNLCRMMSGSVRVTSELGKGSVFTVTLPLEIANESQGKVLEAV